MSEGATLTALAPSPPQPPAPPPFALAIPEAETKQISTTPPSLDALFLVTSRELHAEVTFAQLLQLEARLDASLLLPAPAAGGDGGGGSGDGDGVAPSLALAAPRLQLRPRSSETIELRRRAAERVLQAAGAADARAAALITELLFRPTLPPPPPLPPQLAKLAAAPAAPAVACAPLAALIHTAAPPPDAPRVPVSFDDDLDAFDSLLENGFAVLPVLAPAPAVSAPEPGMGVHASWMAYVWDGAQDSARAFEVCSSANFTLGDYAGTATVAPPGLHLALARVPVGSAATVVVAPRLAYGAAGRGADVPAGSHLVYILRLEAAVGSASDVRSLQVGVLEALARGAVEDGLVVVGGGGGEGAGAAVSDELLRQGAALLLSPAASPPPLLPPPPPPPVRTGSGTGLHAQRLEGGGFAMPSADEAEKKLRAFLATHSGGGGVAAPSAPVPSPAPAPAPGGLFSRRSKK